MAGGNATKIGIVVVALALSVGIFVFTRKPQEAQYVGKESQKDLVCTKCSEHFTMAIKEWEEAVKVAPRAQGDASADQGPRVRRIPAKPGLIKCPKCNEAAAVPAAKCEQSDKWYPKVNPDGTPGKCPD
jgi:hypothetical protein